MRVALVFHKNPFAPPAGIDLIRLRAISAGLNKRGIETDIVAPVSRRGVLEGNIKVYGVERLHDSSAYDIVKTCYHDSIRFVPPAQRIVVSRIVRVVDSKFPERDQKFRSSLLECQKMISERACAVIFNNNENRSRWTSLTVNQQKQNWCLQAVLPSLQFRIRPRTAPARKYCSFLEA